MQMRRLIFTCCLLALAAVPLVAVPSASAKRLSGPRPVITSVAPMRVSVGGLITIRGHNFRPSARGNTLIFRGAGGRTIFGKPIRASRTKLVLRVPPATSRLLTLKNSQQQPTRLQLRALAGNFSHGFTIRRLSPVVVPNSSGIGCKSATDYDHDLLTNSEELDLSKTDPCNADTDGDGIIDGWEFWSAKDLNVKAVPYPGRRPFPNPLDPTDGLTSGLDFDGDGLTTGEEYRAWKAEGRSFDRANLNGVAPPDRESVLGYSDGTQISRANATPQVPAWRSGTIPNYGLPNPVLSFPAAYDLHGDPGVWWDDERDADADGLSNFLESSRGPGQASWWGEYWLVDRHTLPVWPKVKDECTDSNGIQDAGAFTRRPYQDLDLGDPDVDGDTLLDGEDDQDNDDVINIIELYETITDLDGDGNSVPGPAGGCTEGFVPSVNLGTGSRLVNAFNPCAPNPRSRTCPIYRPFN
jgi:hypothetical protein